MTIRFVVCFRFLYSKQMRQFVIRNLIVGQIVRSLFILSKRKLNIVVARSLQRFKRDPTFFLINWLNTVRLVTISTHNQLVHGSDSGVSNVVNVCLSLIQQSPHLSRASTPHYKRFLSRRVK